MSNQITGSEIREEAPYRHAVVIRLLSHFFSYVFHPLFVPLYVTWFIAFIHPSYFTGAATAEKIRLMISVSYTMIFLPLVTVFLSRQLKFIDSFFLKTQKDRIIPYIFCNIYFFWMYLVLKNNENVPLVLTGFIFGVFLSSSVALLANIYYKISMHAIGMGGLAGIFLVIMQSNSMLMSWPLSLALLIAGMVCTSRMIVSDHKPRDIYMGLLVGFICQWAATIVVQ